MKKKVTHIVLIVGSILMVLPFIYMILLSLMTYQESVSVPPTVIPSHFMFSNYLEVFRRLDFATLFINSTIKTVFTTVGVLFISTLAGFTFAKLRFPGKNILFMLIIGIMLIPGQMFLIPQFQTMKFLGWINTLLAVIIPNWVTAYGIFYMRQFFKTVPDELIEAAIMDGYNYFHIYWKIACPLIKPAIIVYAIQTTIGSWNEFLWPLIVNSDPSKQVLPVGISLLSGQHIVETPIVMAASALVILPMILIYVLGQKYFKNIDLSMK